MADRRWICHEARRSSGEAHCRLRLDEGLVSRRHVRLDVEQDGVHIEDLGSVNGTLVNGELLAGQRRIYPGDVIQVASAEIRLDVAGLDDVSSDVSDSQRRAPAEPQPIAADEEPTLVGGAPQRAMGRPSAGIFLTDLADKALSLGKAEDARRLVAAIADTIGREQLPVDAMLVHDFIELSLRMATVAQEWVGIDRIFEVAARQGWRLPQAVVDAIAGIVTTLRPFRGPGFISYLERWRGPSQSDETLATHLKDLLTLVARRTPPGAHA